MTPDPDTPIRAVCAAGEWFVLDEDAWADMIVNDEGDNDE